MWINIQTKMTWQASKGACVWPRWHATRACLRGLSARTEPLSLTGPRVCVCVCPSESARRWGPSLPLGVPHGAVAGEQAGARPPGTCWDCRVSTGCPCPELGTRQRWRCKGQGGACWVADGNSLIFQEARDWHHRARASRFTWEMAF